MPSIELSPGHPGAKRRFFPTGIQGRRSGRSFASLQDDTGNWWMDESSIKRCSRKTLNCSLLLRRELNLSCNQVVRQLDVLLDHADASIRVMPPAISLVFAS